MGPLHAPVVKQDFKILQTKFNIEMYLRTSWRTSQPIFKLENVIGKFETNLGLARWRVTWMDWSSCNISNPTMTAGLDFKSAQFDQVQGEAEDWMKMQGLEI